MCDQLFNHVQLFVAPWTVAARTCQAPLSIGFFRQEYWSRLPFPSPGALPNPRIEPISPALTGRFFTTEPPENPKQVERGLKYGLADGMKLEP